MEQTLEKIQSLYDGEDREKLLKAYEYAKNAHLEQKRASGLG